MKNPTSNKTPAVLSLVASGLALVATAIRLLPPQSHLDFRTLFGAVFFGLLGGYLWMTKKPT